MTGVAVLSNPLSHRNPRQLGRIAAMLNGRPDVIHVTVDDFAALPSALADCARREVSILAVNGGDGTVQAVLTALITRRPFDRMPRLVILRGGRTNQTANDVGPAGGAAHALARLLVRRDCEDLDRLTLWRPMLIVDRVRDGTRQCGAFFGGQSIVTAIGLCRARAHAVGLSAGLASAWTLGNAVFEWLIRPHDCRLFQGQEIEIRVDGVPLPSRRWTLVLVTVLDRLVLGCRPFWDGDDTAPLRFTGFTHPPRHLLRHLPRLLYGGQRRHLPEDAFLSRGARSVSLAMSESFTIDGEFYDPAPGRPLTISASEPLPFLRC